jgi:type IV pilus assembly protein PilZ
MSDKRSDQRISYPCEVECSGMGTGANNPLNPRLSDLSVTGAFIDSVVPVPKGTKLKLKFSVRERPINVIAEVVHEMPQFGMGVRFLDLTAEDRSAIQELIRQG